MMPNKMKITVFILLGVLAALIIVAVGVFFSDEILSAFSTVETVDYELKSKELEREKARLTSELDELKSQLAKLEANLADSGKYYADEIDELKSQIIQKNNAIAALEADIARYETVYAIDVLAQARLIDDLLEYIETMSPYVRVLADNESEDSSDTTAEAVSDTTAEGTSDTSNEEPVYTWVKVSDLIEEELAARDALGDEAEPLFTPEELAASGITETEFTKMKLREIVLSREDVTYPKVSVYYEDLTTGYHFEYDENAAYPAASVIKAPFILSALMQVSADEKAFFERLEAENKEPEMIDTDEDGTPDKVVIEYSDPKYNLYETIALDKATMIESGSGKIREMPDGTEFTYIDFIKYALEYSDNIAYQQLKKRFGIENYYALARSVGATVASKSARNMSAADAGKLFKEIYKFIGEDETYGPLMRESMTKTNHKVIIPLGVSPTTALHKYGWDVESYHDAAIVESGDKPYVLAVFSDLEMGGDEVSAYLREIVKMINKLHKGFYAN